MLTLFGALVVVCVVHAGVVAVLVRVCTLLMLLYEIMFVCISIYKCVRAPSIIHILILCCAMLYCVVLCIYACMYECMQVDKNIPAEDPLMRSIPNYHFKMLRYIESKT